MENIINYTEKEYIRFIHSQEKLGAIEELARLFPSDVCTDTEALMKALKEREEIMSTGIGFGIAIPHAKIPSVKRLVFAMGISREGLPFDSIDGNYVHLVLLIAAGDKEHKEYLRLLSSIMAVLKNEENKKKIIDARSPEEILEIFAKA